MSSMFRPPMLPPMPSASSMRKAAMETMKPKCSHCGQRSGQEKNGSCKSCGAKLEEVCSPNRS